MLQLQNIKLLAIQINKKQSNTIELVKQEKIKWKKDFVFCWLLKVERNIHKKEHFTYKIRNKEWKTVNTEGDASALHLPDANKWKLRKT